MYHPFFVIFCTLSTIFRTLSVFFRTLSVFFRLSFIGHEPGMTLTDNAESFPASPAEAPGGKRRPLSLSAEGASRLQSAGAIAGVPDKLYSMVTRQANLPRDA